jgi:RNA recognition motif-containing protein
LLGSFAWRFVFLNIFVGNFLFDTTEAELRGLFATFGPVVSVRIIVDRVTGRSRGYGFVEMEDSGQGRVAVERLDGSDFNGRLLKVNDAAEKGKHG